MAQPPLRQFREGFREWCSTALPDEWRYLSRGSDDELVLNARLGWGKRLYAGGWAGIRLPASYGGLGLSTAHHLVAIEEQVRVGAPEPLNLNSTEILAPLLVEHGTEDLLDRYLRPMLSHEHIWCQGFSEPGAGSDLASVRTRAKPTANGWLVTGQKVWTTYGPQADYAYVLVRTDPEAPKHAGISLMIVRLDQPGVTVRPICNIAGSLEFSEIFLDDALVETGDLIGELNDGWRLAMSALSNERGLNIVQRGLNLERELEMMQTLIGNGFVEEDGAIASSAPGRLIDCFVDARAMRSVVGEILECAAAGGVPASLASMAKLHWSEVHQAILGLGVEGMGACLSEPRYAEWVKACLFSRAETIYGGTSEIQRNSLARELGLPSGH